MHVFDMVSRLFTTSTARHTEATNDPAHDLIRMLVFVWFMILIGLVGLLMPALAHVAQGRYIEALVAIGAGAFLASAATAAGSLIGFLFGVPRATRQLTQEPTGTVSRQNPYLPNTNLEQISDWLTKIIVGVGLVEMRAVIAWFGDIGTVVGPAIWANPAGRVMATAILVHDLLMGFFQGFLVAYLYLPKAFANARRLEGNSVNEQEGVRG